MHPELRALAPVVSTRRERQKGLGFQRVSTGGESLGDNTGIRSSPRAHAYRCLLYSAFNYVSRGAHHFAEGQLLPYDERRKGRAGDIHATHSVCICTMDSHFQTQDGGSSLRTQLPQLKRETVHRA
eukprot:1178387-Prorocentrum_minimum.AAC.4